MKIPGELQRKLRNGFQDAFNPSGDREQWELTGRRKTLSTVSSPFPEKRKNRILSILNAARMGKFSSDRSVKEYCHKVWNVQPCPVKLKWKELPEDGVLFHPSEGRE